MTTQTCCTLEYIRTISLYILFIWSFWTLWHLSPKLLWGPWFVPSLFFIPYKNKSKLNGNYTLGSIFLAKLLLLQEEKKSTRTRDVEYSSHSVYRINKWEIKRKTVRLGLSRRKIHYMNSKLGMKFKNHKKKKKFQNKILIFTCINVKINQSNKSMRCYH